MYRDEKGLTCEELDKRRFDLCVIRSGPIFGAKR